MEKYIKRKRGGYSDQEIIEAYKLLSEKLRKIIYGPTATDIEKSYGNSEFPVNYSTVSRRFNGINDLRKQAGYKYIIKKEKSDEKYNKDVIIEAYRELSQKIGSKRGATYRELDMAYEKGEFPIKSYEVLRAFKGINDLRKEAKFVPVNVAINYTIDDVLETARMLYLKTGKINARLFNREMSLICEKYGSWQNFLEENKFYESGISIADKINSIVESSKYIIDKNENRIYYQKNNKELVPSTSENKCRYVFRINKKSLAINKYVFWSYIHNLINDSFDTKYHKIIFKNGKEEYTKENIEIVFKFNKK